MKNKLTDLNNHLFAALERLNDEDIKGEELSAEIERSEAISKIAKTIIDSGTLALQAQKHASEYGMGIVQQPLLGMTDE